jgi:MFS family permease
VIALGAVSFFTDVSSEMIYPLLPLFLASVLGAGPAALGLIEGVAESTAALLKLVSGRWSDRARRRKPLIVAGYGLAGMARPLIGLAGSWPAVLVLRFTDRVGKGLRTSPRDALIADVTPAGRLGGAFGVQRAFDHAGAVIGPLLAAALLGVAGLSLRAVFLLAAIPAAVVIAVLLLAVHEPPRPTPPAAPAGDAGNEPFSGRFTVLLAAVVVFTLGNSADAFLLLRLGDAGFAPARIALLWSVFHVVKAAATWLGGSLSDRLGRRPMVATGWLLYAGVYVAFATITRQAALAAVFLTYGLYFGLTEPVERAWVVDMAPPSRRGAALGLYHGAVGAAALPASLVFGLLWQRFGVAAAFWFGAGAALLATLVLAAVGPGPADRSVVARGTAAGV